jgi:hypothetical protein
MTWTWAEPFAGAAACALRLVGGERLKPPVAWMGGKRRYARAIVDAMGVPEGPPSRVLLADAGPWGWVWPLLLVPADAAQVARILRSWAGEHPRELWQRLAAQPPAEDLHERAAQWLWLQARSASGVPIWWDGWRTNDARWVSTRPQQAGGVRDAKHALDTRKDRAADAPPPERRPKRTTRAATDRGEDMRWPGHREMRGRWEKGNEGRVQDATNGQRGAAPGAWKFAGRPDREQDERPAAMSGDKALADWRAGEEFKKARRGTRTIAQGHTDTSRTGGMINPGTIAERAEAIAESFAGVDAHVHHGEARDLLAIIGRFASPRGLRFAYLDPPYVGATGYGWDMPRAEVLALARRWADAGAVVAVSEAEPLALEGWHHLELTREGGKPEWLTLSRAPARLPARQASLFPPESLPA